MRRRSPPSFALLALASAAAACVHAPPPKPALAVAVHVAPASPARSAAPTPPAPSPPAAPAVAAPAPPPAAPAAPPRACGHDAWSTYAHDAARTSASDGCVDPPLRVAWSFSPAPFGGRSGRVHHAIAEGDAVYAAGLRGDSPVLHRLTTDGEPSWTFDSRADIHRDHWPSLALGKALVNDDGFYWIDLATGRHDGHGLDTWGPSLTDGARVYATNTWQEDGPGLFVAAYDAAGKLVWKKDRFAGRHIVIPDLGGIALDGGRIFHAANYRFPSHSGLFALDPSTGERVWEARTMPLSAPSAKDGRVLTVEELAPKEETLVARSAEDGTILWSRAVRGARGPAPLLAGALVVVHGEDGVVAFDAASGEAAWTAPVARTASQVGSATSLAAAMGSRTLVVTGGGRVSLVSLDDGHVLWSGAPKEGARDVHSPIVVAGAVYVVVDGALVSLASAPAEVAP